MKDIKDIHIKTISKIIEDYLACLNSIKDTFDSTFDLLKKNDINARQVLVDFLNKCNSKNSNLDVSLVQAKTLKLIVRKFERAELAAKIFPQSMLVSLVSQYDYLIGQIVQFIYQINPNLLNDSNSQISYKDLFKYTDLDTIKNKIIQDKIETILRNSHEEQIDDLQKLSGVKNLKSVSFWKEFVEITQRRNLFVHCKGRVSDQYIQKCNDVGIISVPDKGTELDVDDNYFSNAYFVFYIMGVLLSQVITRHLLKKEKVISEIDSLLNNIIYETLEEEQYDIAIELSKFALADTTKHDCVLDTVYFVLNYAQAYKWKGNHEECNKILSEFDFSAMKADILVAKYALEENVDKVIEYMHKIGSTSDIMTKESYLSWVIFKEMREKKEFQDAYKSIFGEELNLNLLTSKENEVINLNMGFKANIEQ